MHVIFDRSIIDTSQRCDTSRSGLVNLKANSTLFKQKSLPQEKLYRLGRILPQNIACISLLNLLATKKHMTCSRKSNNPIKMHILDVEKKKRKTNCILRLIAPAGTSNYGHCGEKMVWNGRREICRKIKLISMDWGTSLLPDLPRNAATARRVCTVGDLVRSSLIPAVTWARINEEHTSLNVEGSFNPFTPKSDQFKISPAASPVILHHSVET